MRKALGFRLWALGEGGAKSAENGGAGGDVERGVLTTNHTNYTKRKKAKPVRDGGMGQSVPAVAGPGQNSRG